jgi:ketosteroid isomerase-like protein
LGASANLTTLRAFYEAVNRGDIERILDLQAEDVEWRGPQAFPDLTEPHHGHSGVRAYTERVGHAWREFRIQPERFFDFGERVLVLAREHGCGRDSGLEVQHPTAHLWTLRDGLVVRFQVFWDREEGLREAGVTRRAASPAQP